MANDHGILPLGRQSSQERAEDTGAALVMSPALVTKYLDAAKEVAQHAVLLPDGIRFSPNRTRSDWTNETLARIREFYRHYSDAGGGDMQAVTLAFDAFDGSHDDETGGAAEVARLYGAPHAIRRVGLTELRDDLPRILASMDQPSIDGVNTWFVSKATRELGLKVALSGLGGDEQIGRASCRERV